MAFGSEQLAEGLHAGADLLEAGVLLIDLDAGAGDAVPRDAVFLPGWEGGCSLLDVLLHLGVELLHDGGGGWPSLPGARSTAALNRETVLAALAACGGNREKTAEYLGISRRYLQYKIREYHTPPRCRCDQGS